MRARLAGVTVRRGGRDVVADVSLDVRDGEVLVVAGPNGAGKSTLLAALAGDVRPASGTVEVAGRDVRARSTVELAQQRSVLLQSGPVPFGFTVTEVVAMGRAPWPTDGDHVVRALADCEIAHLASRPVSALSGGERARVDLARVLAQDTPLVLLDEPTAALDLRHTEAVMGHARRLAGLGRAVVAVVHDLDLAASYGDRVALLSAGRLVAVGAPADVLRPDVVGDVYGHPVEVLPHPVTGRLLVLPAR